MQRNGYLTRSRAHNPDRSYKYGMLFIYLFFDFTYKTCFPRGLLLSRLILIVYCYLTEDLLYIVCFNLWGFFPPLLFTLMIPDTLQTFNHSFLRYCTIYYRLTLDLKRFVNPKMYMIYITIYVYTTLCTTLIVL